MGRYTSRRLVLTPPGNRIMPKFSAKLMEHFSAPRNQGRLEAPDPTGLSGTPNRGPFLRLELLLRDGVIAYARFQAHACGPPIPRRSPLPALTTAYPLTHAHGCTP